MSNTLFNVPLEERLIGAFLAKQSQRIGDKTFLEFENSVWTFSEVNEEALAAAKGLLKLNIKPQTGVLVMLPNCPEMVFSWFGCALIRAVNIPINPHLMGDILARPFIASQSA